MITSSPPYVITDGTAGSPGFFFGLDPDTGFYRIGSGNVGLSLNGTKAWDFAATVTSFTGANSTSNTTFTVENTSNAAAASHAIIEAKVGGTTSTGSPQFRLTIPGGTAWYFAAANAVSDNLYVGTGTTVQSAYAFGASATLTAGTGANANFFVGGRAQTGETANWAPATLYIEDATFTKTDQVANTALIEFTHGGILTIAQSGGAVTVNKATGHSSSPATAGASVTLTHSSAYRALTGGASVNASGYYAEKQTAGTTNNFQFLMETGGTEPANAVVDLVGLYAVDIAAGRATLGIRCEETVIATAELASTHKLVARINGVSYAFMLTSTLT